MSSGYFGQSDQMEHRQLGGELDSIVGASGGLLDLQREEATKMGADQLKLAGDYAMQGAKLYPELLDAERKGTTAQRRQDAGDLRKLGPGIDKWIGQINPNWKASLSALNEEAGKAGEESALLKGLNTTAIGGLAKADALSPSALRMALTQGAESDLALGRELSPEQEREVQQSTRAAYSSRGIVNSDPALIGEVLARDSAGSARESARRQYAAAIQQLGQSEDQSLLARWAQYAQTGQGVEGLNQQEQQAGRSLLATNVGAQQNALAPTLGFFGRTGISPTAGAGVLQGAPSIIGAGTGAVNPALQYGSDVFNTNFNSDAATKISNANNMAAIHGAIIGAVGSLTGAAAKCWVAREVFGETRNANGALKWELFRRWLEMKAPRWLDRLYAARGEAFAGWLRRHGSVKRILRPCMERAIKVQMPAPL